MLMMEQRLLAAMMEDRKVYELFETIGNAEILSPIGKRVHAAVAEYFSVDPSVESILREAIRDRELSRLTNDKHAAPLKQYFDSLPQGVSTANVERDIRELHRRSVDGKLSLALANGQSEEEIQKLIQERSKSETTLAVSDRADSIVDVLCTDDLTTEDTTNVNYIKLWPKALNDRLDGGALRGHHVLVFARPEQGKTLFAINLCAGFLHQRLSVLYVGNEEPVADIRDRVRGRLLKTSKASVRGNRAETARRLALVELGSLRITEGTTFAGVRSLLGAGAGEARELFDVVILDQVRNMRLKSDSRTSELEAAGIEARAIAKDFGVLVVSITQAGDSATNKVYLEMSDVDSSKTGIPASADLMIGLGSDAAMKLNNLMGLSLCKNKMSGDHAKLTVSCNFSTGEVI